MRGQTRNRILTALASLWGALALTTHLAPLSPDSALTAAASAINTAASSSIPAAAGVWDGLSQALRVTALSAEGGALLGAVLFAGLYALLSRYLINGRRRPCEWMLGSLFALITLLCGAADEGGTIAVLWQSGALLARSVLVLLGRTVVWTALVSALYTLLAKPSGQGRAWAHPFGMPLVILTLVWLPQIIVRYPGVFTWDTSEELEQYYYQWIAPFSTHHPPVHTIVCGLFFRLGEALGSASAGMYLLTLLQSAAMLCLLAYSVSTLQQLGAPGWLRTGTLLLYALLPLYSAYATTLVKDTPYAMAVLLLLLQLARLLQKGRAFCQSPKELALLSIAVAVAVVARKNGVYIVVPTLAVGGITLVCKRWPARRIGALALACAAGMGVGYGVQELLVRHYDMQPGSRREALSLPFQQTARVLSLHEDELSQPEREALSRVLDLDSIGYLPRLADPAKGAFREACTSADLGAYFRVWAAQAARYPVEYLDAALLLHGRLLDPAQPINTTLWQQTSGGDETHNETCTYRHRVGRVIHGWDPREAYGQAAVYPAGEALADLYDLMAQLPGVSWLMSMPLAVYLTLALGCWLLLRRRAALIAWLPVFLSVGVCFLSPISSERYALPIFYALPVLTALAAEASAER